MFFKWIVSSINNEQVLFLYLQNDYEFAKELFNKEKAKSITNKINDYIKNNNIIYNGNKVYIVSKNLVVGSATINNNQATKIKSYVDIDKLFENEIEIIDIADKEKTDFANQNSISEIKRKFIIKNYKEDMEDEAIKVVLTILNSNLILELTQFGYIKSTKYYFDNKDLNNISNDFLRRINESIKKTENTIILTNNVHRELALLTYKSDVMNRINIMVKAGYNYKQIIKFFYPKSSITSLKT